jgi:hypothetical protein
LLQLKKKTIRTHENFGCWAADEANNDEATGGLKQKDGKRTFSTLVQGEKVRANRPEVGPSVFGGTHNRSAKAERTAKLP